MMKGEMWEDSRKVLRFFKRIKISRLGEFHPTKLKKVTDMTAEPQLITFDKDLLENRNGNAFSDWKKRDKK